MSDLDALIGALKRDLNERSVAAKQDIVISWMEQNYKLFCPSRVAMKQALKMLSDGIFPYTVDGLQSALSTHAALHIYKGKFEDAPKLYMNITKVKGVLDTINKLREEQNEIALLYVAGDRSTVITNMQTNWPTGVQYSIYRSIDIQLVIFKYTDAAVMLPAVFNHKE